MFLNLYKNIKKIIFTSTSEMGKIIILPISLVDEKC